MQNSIPQRRLPRPVLRVLGLTALLVLATAATSLAQEKPGPGKVETGAVAEALSSLQVFVDPATGKLRSPSPEEAKAMAANLERIFSRSTEGLEVKQLSDGTLALDLQGRFLSVSVARRNSDGSVVTDCTNSLQQALSWLGAAPAPQPRPALERE